MKRPTIRALAEITGSLAGGGAWLDSWHDFLRGPAPYGSNYHCSHCGNKGKDIRYWRQDPDIPRCWLDGELLVFDEGRGLWVDPVTGTTYEPGSAENPPESEMVQL
jgi:hypothetical protein